MTLDDLPTPVLLLDRQRVMRNIARMRERAQLLKVQLRPHLKTAKSVKVALLCHNGEAGPITVSTLAEAAYFARAGFRDITYAVPVAPQKLEQVAEIMAINDGTDLKLITDHVDVAKAIAAKGQALGITYRVLIKIDCGLGRAGIAPNAPDLLPLAEALNQPGAQLAGVLTHAGHSYGAKSVAEIERIAEEERTAVLLAASRLREAGHDCEIVSVGSTPTALFARHLDGITEMRPGNFVFFDLFQAGLGSCGLEDIAVSVLASVVSHHQTRNHLLIDAGGLALSKDTGANQHTPGTGYGRVCRPTDALPLPNMAIHDVHQEHGLVGGPQVPPVDFAAFPPGTRLRVLTNHICMTGAMYDRYYVTDGGSDVVAEWDRVNGW